MSLVPDVAGEWIGPLAVLYCDIRPTDEAALGELEIAGWREIHFRAARELAADYGGLEATTAVGGWSATFTSTVDALMCARALSLFRGWETGLASLSGGLSAGEVVRDALGIAGSPVKEAISLCRLALPGQVLVADPLKVVVARETARSFAPASIETMADAGTPMFRGREGRGGRPVPSRRRRAPESRLRLLAPAAPAPDPDPPRRLTVLGWVQIESAAREGRPPPVARAVMRGRQARAVVTMLALKRGPVHKEELAELLWPEALPDHWEGAIRGLITKIRRFLDEGGLPARDVLVVEDGYYELHLPPGVTVDRDDATTLLAEAERARAAGRFRDAADPARQAAAILERRLLSGDNNQWFDQIRAELAYARLSALELWAGAELAAGNVEGAQRATAQALALDPYRESSHRLSMQACAAAGSRAEALRAYERCRRMLADDLGVGPAPQTQALYIHLLG